LSSFDVDEPALPTGDGGLSRHLVRVRLDLAYEGTAYAGWARQNDQPSVQAVVEDALGVVLRSEPPRLTVAGRTDAGVHARGQVAHVDVPAEVAGDALLLRRLNGLLPLDVRVLSAAPAAAGFDARFAAVSRTYCYRIADRPALLDPLKRAFVLVRDRELDLPAMREACQPMIGVHDFAAYCRRREGATTVRGLLQLDWERSDRGLAVMTVEADAFCHSMVRSLVGAMIAVGEGRRTPNWPSSLLTLGSRSSEVLVAPPHGLVLEAVAYPPDDELLARQDITRRLRS